LVRRYENPTDDIEPRESAGVSAIDRGHILASRERRAAMFGYVFDWPFGDFTLARCLIFGSLRFFSFSREAKLGEFRPSAPAQVVCRLAVAVWQWGEIF
jgi:hypothetical protein